MKRTISIVILIIMIAGVSVPAAAEEWFEDLIDIDGTVTDNNSLSPEEAMKAELTEITEYVVAVLDVKDDYTSFISNFNDNIPSRWSLHWTGEDESLSVSCSADHTITEVSWYSDSEAYDDYHGFESAFSSLSMSDARELAEQWLKKLMPEGETARIDSISEPIQVSGLYDINGTILYHGFETPMTFSMNVNADRLRHYYRSTCSTDYIGEMPGDTAYVSEESAAASLYPATQFELYYVTAGDEARLRYVPVKRDYIVDALTGETADMTALYASFGPNRAYGTVPYPLGVSGVEDDASEAQVSDNGRALTEIEQSSINNYTDVQPKETLDMAARSISALGLSGFLLDECSYSADEDGNVFATLRYTCEITPDNLFGLSEATYYESSGNNNQLVVTKHITVNAKTAALTSVSTSYPVWDQDRVNTASENEALEFLKLVAPEMAAQSALCTLSDYMGQSSGLTFSRVWDGYFFPENYLYVEINPATGAVDRYYYTWNDEAVFAPSDSLVSEEDARNTYTGALDVTLGIATWPEAVDYNDPAQYKYASWGYSYVESLKLAYYYNGKNTVAGIDAVTGELIPKTSLFADITYDDLDGSASEEMLLRLAQINIGYMDGFFHPDMVLTMRDAATLLTTAAGYRSTDPDDEFLKRTAIRYHFITSEEWDPEKELTIGEFIHLLLSGSYYRYTISIPGLWDGQDGALQIASALNMLDDATSTDDMCTRAEAVKILYQFMNRFQDAE